MAPISSGEDPTVERFVAGRIRRIPRVGSREIDAKVERLREEGIDVIQLKPYPSTSLPPHIVEAAERAARESINPPSRGIPEFLEAVAASLSTELSIRIDPENEVLATSGGMHALYIVFATLLDHGDEVLVPSPSYFLEGLIEPLGATIVDVPMSSDNDYRWDCDLLDRGVTKNTKLIFLNTPVNPTGYVLTIEDLERVAMIANRHDLLVVADESYDKLTYDGLRHVSIASLKGMRRRTILVRSFTKSYAMPNWRVGYIVSSKELVKAFTRTCEWMVLYGNYVSQKAATAALVGPQGWLVEATSQLEISRNLIHEGIRGISELSCVKPQGGPFIFPNVSRLRGNCDEICDRLLREFGVSSVPGPYFRSDNHIRIAFGGPKQLIDLLLDRLKQAVQEIGIN